MTDFNAWIPYIFIDFNKFVVSPNKKKPRMGLFEPYVVEAKE